MLFAVSLIFVFLILGLMIYRSELFHVTSDDEFYYKDDFTESEPFDKKVSYQPKDFRKRFRKSKLEKTKL